MQIQIIQILFGSTLILSAALAVVLFFRKRSASFRHAVWAFAMLGLLILPLATPFLPRYPLFLAEPALELQEEQTPRSDEPHIVATKASDVVENEVVAQTSTVAAPVVATIALPKPGIQAPKEKSKISWPVFLAAIWFAVAAFRFVRLAVSRLYARNILHRSRPCTEKRFAEWSQRICRKIGIAKTAPVLQYHAASVPFVVGVFRPVIVLPEESEHWETQELETVLTHELAHIARMDIFWQTLAQIASALYWFHPLVWLGTWCMRVERELACDDAVLYHGSDPARYANVLLELAAGLGLKSSGQSIPACAIAMARRSIVRERIESIMNSKRNRKPLGHTKIILLGLVALVAAGILAMIVPFERRKPTEQEIENAKKLAIAVDPESPKVTIRGTVLLPDGSPAPMAMVSMTATEFRKQKSSGDIRPYYASFGRYESTDSSNPNGEFEFFVAPGSNVILEAMGDTQRPHRYPRRLVSQPFIFSPKTENEPITLKLEEGIPVHVDFRYENGRPASKRSTFIYRYLEPVVGSEFEVMRNSTETQNGYTLDEQGQITVYLPPGEYRVRSSDPAPTWNEALEKTVLVEQGRENRAELKLPNPVFVQIFSDGKPLGNTQVVFQGHYRFQDEPAPYSKTGQRTDENGVIPVFLSGVDTFLSVIDKDNEFGIVKRIEPDVPGSESSPENPRRIDLFPTATVQLRFVHFKSGNPLIYKEVHWSQESYVAKQETPELTISSTASALQGEAMTDSDGYVLLRVPASEDKLDGIRFSINPPGVSVEVTPKGTVYSPVIYFQGVKPGETTDLGTFRIDGADDSEPTGWFVAPGELSPEMTIESENDLVDFRGRVLLPDGSPAPGYRVDLIYHYSTKDSSGSSSHGLRTNADGYFSLKVGRMCKVGMIAFDAKDKSHTQTGPLVSEPLFLTYIHGETPEPVLTLAEGTPVHGKIRYKNGESATERRIDLSFPYTITAERRGQGATKTTQVLSVNIIGYTNEQGEYRFYAPKGLASIKPWDLNSWEAAQSREIAVKKGQAVALDDFVLETPLRVRVLLADGTPLKNRRSIRSQHTFTPRKTDGQPMTEQLYETDENGVFAFFPSPGFNAVTIDTEDHTQGIVQKIDPENAAGELEIRLRPCREIRMRLIDKETKKAIVGEKVGCGLNFQVEWTTSQGTPTISSSNMGFGNYGNAISNADGNVTLRVPVFSEEMKELSYRVWLPEKNMKPMADGTLYDAGRYHRIRPTASGEPLDLGIFELGRARFPD